MPDSDPVPKIQVKGSGLIKIRPPQIQVKGIHRGYLDPAPQIQDSG